MTPVTDKRIELRKMGFGNPSFCLRFFCLSILLSPFLCLTALAAEPLLEKTILFTARNSHAESRRLVTRSADGATNWSTPVFADELLEPGCMAGIITHPGNDTVNGPLLLFSHPHTTAQRQLDFPTDDD